MKNLKVYDPDRVRKNCGSRMESFLWGALGRHLSDVPKRNVLRAVINTFQKLVGPLLRAAIQSRSDPGVTSGVRRDGGEIDFLLV